MVVRRGQRRDFQALEQRRKQAARLFARGTEALASIARQLKVSRQSVSRWHHEWKQRGARALNAAGRAGRKPRLSAGQLRRVEAALEKGAAFHGFSANLMDVAESCDGDRADYRGQVSSRPRVEDSRCHGLVFAEAGAAGQRAQRGAGRVLEDGPLA